MHYQTTDAEIQDAIAEFSAEAEWIGTQKEGAEQRNVVEWSINYSCDGANGLPEDFTVYLLYGRPYREGNWNHGEVRLAAISARRGEILYYSDQW